MGMKIVRLGMLIGGIFLAVGCGGTESALQEDTPVQGDTPALEDATVGDVQPSADPGLLNYVKSQPKAEVQAPSAAKDPGNGSLGIQWDDLAGVTFSSKYYEEIDEWLLFPVFGEGVTALEGKQIFVAGYVIPLEPGLYFLSRNSFQSCFFCGGAGPESVI